MTTVQPKFGGGAFRPITPNQNKNKNKSGTLQVQHQDLKLQKQKFEDAKKMVTMQSPISKIIPGQNLLDSKLVIGNDDLKFADIKFERDVKQMQRKTEMTTVDATEGAFGKAVQTLFANSKLVGDAKLESQVKRDVTVTAGLDATKGALGKSVELQNLLDDEEAKFLERLPKLLPEGKQLYRCKKCFSIFNHHGSAIKHSETHNESRDWKCDKCPKRFRNKIFLQRHTRVHSDEKPVKCERCNKRFRSKTYLDEHILLHDNIKNHVCEICSKSFVSKSKMKSHQKMTHEAKTDAASLEWKSCTIKGCGYKTTSANALRCHLFRCKSKKPTGDTNPDPSAGDDEDQNMANQSQTHLFVLTAGQTLKTRHIASKTIVSQRLQ